MDEASLGAGVLLLPLGTGLAGVFGVLACVSLVYELRERRRRGARGDQGRTAWGARFLVALGFSVICLAGPFVVLRDTALARRANEDAPLWAFVIAVAGSSAIYFVGRPSR
ncbi:MAG TPA: hypothetical protein VNN80_22990 [Polyangiaceae bacterium]|nr:hypothetical protein [Polyangiaceae bacterium]